MWVKNEHRINELLFIKGCVQKIVEKWLHFCNKKDDWMAYTYKNEFVNFKLLVNQSVTSNMTISKNIIDELFKNKNEKVWFA